MIRGLLGKFRFLGSARFCRLESSLKFRGRGGGVRGECTSEINFDPGIYLKVGQVLGIAVVPCSRQSAGSRSKEHRDMSLEKTWICSEYKKT